MTKKLFHVKGIVENQYIAVFECVAKDITLAIEAVRNFQKLNGGIQITDVSYIKQESAVSNLYVKLIGGYRF